MPYIRLFAMPRKKRHANTDHSFSITSHTITDRRSQFQSNITLLKVVTAQIINHNITVHTKTKFTSLHNICSLLHTNYKSGDGTETFLPAGGGGGHGLAAAVRWGAEEVAYSRWRRRQRRELMVEGTRRREEHQPSAVVSSSWDGRRDGGKSDDRRPWSVPPPRWSFGQNPMRRSLRGIPIGLVPRLPHAPAH
jgi:hypothetical protein